MQVSIRLCFAAWLLTLVPAIAQARDVAIRSPDGRVTIAVSIDDAITWQVDWRGSQVLAPAPIGLRFAGQAPASLHVASVETTEHDAQVTGLSGKASSARDHYREAVITLAGGAQPLALVIRAYDDGTAYRWRFRTAASFAIAGEDAGFGIPDDAQAWATSASGFDSSYEDYYRTGTLREATRHGALVALPLLFHHGDAWAAITEAALHDWSGLYLVRSDGVPGLSARLSPRLDVADIAVRGATGEHESPWRVLMLGDAPGRLVESNLVMLLNPPPDDRDWSWLRPGKTSFPWWNNYVWPGQPFEPGLNTATMKAYIDFDAEHGIEYHTLDGVADVAWYGGPIVPDGTPQDVTHARAQIDMPEVMRHAKERGVGIRLWTHWKPFSEQIDAALAAWQAWGVTGIMIDFMNRDDQQMVDLYEEISRKAADHRMSVVFHGAFKPTGRSRSWPNVFSYEAVRGTEYNKFGGNPGSTPLHETIVPFARMLAGPLDVHQGGFTYVAPGGVDAGLPVPSLVGTRARALAAYVVLDDQMPMVADTPTNYRDALGLDFIAAVPVNWDETRVLSGTVGEQIVIARRRDRTWWIGAITNERARTITVPLSMLGEGKWQLDEFADVGETRTARHARRSVRAGEHLILTMGTAGGYAARIAPAGDATPPLGRGARDGPGT